MAKFRVLHGKHHEEAVQGDPTTLRTYRTGEIVDSHTDLLRLNSSNSRKFEKIEEDPKASAQPNRAFSAAELGKMHADAVANERLAETVRERVQAEKNNPTSIANPSLVQSTSVKSQPPKTQAEAIAKLDQMSLKDLQQVAADEEIDLKGANKREDVLRIVKSQLVK